MRTLLQAYKQTKLKNGRLNFCSLERNNKNSFGEKKTFEGLKSLSELGLIVRKKFFIRGKVKYEWQLIVPFKNSKKNCMLLPEIPEIKKLSLHNLLVLIIDLESMRNFKCSKSLSQIKKDIGLKSESSICRIRKNLRTNAVYNKCYFALRDQMNPSQVEKWDDFLEKHWNGFLS